MLQFQDNIYMLRVKPIYKHSALLQFSWYPFFWKPALGRVSKQACDNGKYHSLLEGGSSCGFKQYIGQRLNVCFSFPGFQVFCGFLLVLYIYFFIKKLKEDIILPAVVHKVFLKDCLILSLRMRQSRSVCPLMFGMEKIHWPL